VHPDVVADIDDSGDVAVVTEKCFETLEESGAADSADQDSDFHSVQDYAVHPVEGRASAPTKLRDCLSSVSVPRHAQDECDYGEDADFSPEMVLEYSRSA
jgi:hypothetical protein